MSGRPGDDDPADAARAEPERHDEGHPGARHPGAGRPVAEHEHDAAAAAAGEGAHEGHPAAGAAPAGGQQQGVPTGPQEQSAPTGPQEQSVPAGRQEQSVPAGRQEQLAYSELMDRMLDERGRRTKAAKILAVVRHALGVTDLAGLRAVDVGCSAGFIADELALAGAATSGVDIDEPGLARARERFGERVDFRLARGEDLPFDDASVDLVVLNHIYEHVVDPEAVVADIHRVLRPGGLLYLGAGHRFQVVEPHHRLPFLSWLPQRAADRYLRLTGRGDSYYEHYYTPAGLRRLVAAFDVWDYTPSVLADPAAFAAGDQVPGWASRVPARAFAVAAPLAPTYVWAAFKGPATPSGPPLRLPPRHLG